MNILRTRQIIGWTISGLLAILFIYSAAGKLFFQPEQMGQMHLANWRIIIALGEIGSSILFLFPRTNVYGTLLLSSYLGGAIIIHMTGGMSILLPAVILVTVWVIGFIRNPELLMKQVDEN